MPELYARQTHPAQRSGERALLSGRASYICSGSEIPGREEQLEIARRWIAAYVVWRELVEQRAEPAPAR